MEAETALAEEPQMVSELPSSPMATGEAPMRIIGGSNESLSQSSLSDQSRDEMVVSPSEEQPLNIRQSNFGRRDSATLSSGSQRASSQNSSRDWGWFEDVHQSSDHLKSPSPRKLAKKNPDKVKEMILSHPGKPFSPKHTVHAIDLPNFGLYGLTIS